MISKAEYGQTTEFEYYPAPLLLQTPESQHRGSSKTPISEKELLKQTSGAVFLCCTLGFGNSWLCWLGEILLK